MVELADRYHITSNHESGFGRYDIMLEPKEDTLHAVIIEFKVHNHKNEQTLEDTVQMALRQIKEKNMLQYWRQKEYRKNVFAVLDFPLKERKF